MSTVVSLARETRTVRCPECGETRELSVRQNRRLANGSQNYVCTLCRSVPSEIIVLEEHKEYWLERKSMEWIKETAYMIWGEKH